MTARPLYDHPRNRAAASGKARILQYYVLIALFTFGTALKPFLGADNRNLLLIGLMFLSPILLSARRVRRTHLILYLFLASIVVIPPIMNPEHLRWSTILFTGMFALSFIAYENALRSSRLEIEAFTGAVRVLLMAYVAVLLVQQVGVLTGLPILNESNYNAQSGWKLNALSAEASHTARNVSVLMFAYVSLVEIATGRKYSFKHRLRRDLPVWAGFFWLVVTMQSATALVFLPIVLFKAANRRNFGFILGAIVLTALAIVVTSSGELARVSAFVDAAVTFDYRLLMVADHSGSLRVAPMFVLAERVELFSMPGLFGHGIDTVGAFMADYIYGVERGYTGGGMLSVWYEYGFVAFALFIVFTLRVTESLRSISNFVFWLLIVFVAGPNNQIVWLFLIVFASVSHFRGAAARRQQTGFSSGTGGRHGHF